MQNTEVWPHSKKNYLEKIFQADTLYRRQEIK